MNFTDKVYVIKTSIILFFLGMAAYIFETVPSQAYPHFNTHYIGYIAWSSASLLFLVVLFVNALKKEVKSEEVIQEVANTALSQESLRLLLSFKDTVVEVQYLNSLITEVFDESILEQIQGILKNKREDLMSSYIIVKNSLEHNKNSDLFNKFMTTYFAAMDSALSKESFNKGLTIKKLKSLDAKDSVLELLLSRVNVKKDELFNLSLDH